MKRVTLCIISVAALLAAGPTLAADAVAGKIKSTGCTGCHGLNGISNNPNNPSLAGQKEAYLNKAIKDYRDGARKDPMMESMVKGLSDADIADLAAFYAMQKP